MPQATHRRSLKHKNVPIVITPNTGANTLTIDGNPIKFLKTKENKFHTHHLPYSEFPDIESMARAIIDADPSRR